MHKPLKLLTRDGRDHLESREALIRPRTFNRNTVEVIAATATPVNRGAFDEILDVRGADLAAFRGASVLNGHRGDGGVDAIIGTVIEARLDGEQIIATVQLSERGDLAPIIRDIEAGIINQVSIGYHVSEWRDGTANGRRTRTAVKWAPRELSFVAVGADPNARTRSRDPAPTSRAAINRQIRELAARAGVAPRHVDDLIDREASVEDARGVIFDQLVTRGALPIRTAVGTDYSDPAMQTRAVADALYGKMTGRPPANGPALELFHRSAIDLMAHTLRMSGARLDSESPMEVYRAAMSRSAHGLHTTSDFPTVLGNTMGRRLGELFIAAQSGASAIAAPGTARDFRPVTEARLTSFPSLEPVAESGEIKWGSLDEEGEVLAIASFARAIGISFQVMVNDDLSAVDRSIRDVAFATAQLKAKLIVAALSASLADGKALFHADHDNLAASGAPPSDETLSDGRVGMMMQEPPGSDEPLGLSPAILLVPAALQTTAEKLVAAINPASSDDVNVFAGRLQVAVEPRLADDKAWYLFSAPATYPTIRFLTLAGYEAPTFETASEFDRLGTAFRVHWHVAAGPIDWRGAWKNPGQ